jgi:hypothetical protein
MKPMISSEIQRAQVLSEMLKTLSSLMGADDKISEEEL